MIDMFVNDSSKLRWGQGGLVAYAKDHPEVRHGWPFMEIQQAMGTPKGRTAGAEYLRAFVEDVKASGFVADAIKRANQSASVAPPAAK
jgi:polar amino acid transport system substrate-binding protein